MITGKNYVGSQLMAEGNMRMRTFNPQSNMYNDWEFTEATDTEVEQALTLAHTAYEIYRNIPGKQKATFLNAIADEILKLENNLIEIYCSESGLPPGRADGERNRTIAQLRSFASMVAEGSWIQATIDTAIPNRQPLPKEDIRKMLVPIGPVVIFGASNFPFAFSTAGGDTVSALAAGCPVIVKSHPMHLATGELMASAIIKAAQKTGMPNGVFSNLNGGISLGTKLVKHPLVKAVGFTGSITGGRALMDMAAQRAEPIPVFAEMGSINPVVLLPGALEKNAGKWAAAFAASITLGAGQFCTNPGLMLALKGDGLNRFEQLLSQQLSTISSSCMLHPDIKTAFVHVKQSFSSQSGVHVLFETKEEELPNHISPTLLTVDGQIFLKNKMLQREAFGPLSLIVKCDDKLQLRNILDQLDGQLSGTIISESDDLQSYLDIVAALQHKVGRMVFNAVPTGTEVCAPMVHGGPYPASSDSRYTAIGENSILRWVRPVCFQNYPDELLPPGLQNSNPLQIIRTVNNQLTASVLNICQEKPSFA